jgi:hypothetical protein
MAFRTDLECVSTPRKKITRRASLFIDHSLSCSPDRSRDGTGAKLDRFSRNEPVKLIDMTEQPGFSRLREAFVSQLHRLAGD